MGFINFDNFFSLIPLLVLILIHTILVQLKLHVLKCFTLNVKLKIELVFKIFCHHSLIFRLS
jgi:hypothetical protein